MAANLYETFGATKPTTFPEMPEGAHLAACLFQMLGGSLHIDENGDRRVMIPEPCSFDEDLPALPIALLAQAVPMLTRHELAALAERLIDALDAMDPDADLEEDDPAGQCDEDGVNTGQGAFWMHGNSFDGPGCYISDGGL